MGIIYCINCEGKCSSALASCPHCGHPIGGEITSKKKGKAVTTTQRTSKKYKFFSATGFIAAIVGTVIAVNADSPTTGVLLVCVGVIFLLYGSIGGWWHHG